MVQNKHLYALIITKINTYMVQKHMVQTKHLNGSKQTYVSKQKLAWFKTNTWIKTNSYMVQPNTIVFYSKATCFGQSPSSSYHKYNIQKEGKSVMENLLIGSTELTPSLKCLTVSSLFLSLFLWCNSPLGHGVLIIKASQSHSDIPHSVGLLWVSDQPHAETSTSQHTTLTTDIHAPSGIRIHNPSKRAAADPPLRPRGHWDRLPSAVTIQNAVFTKSNACLHGAAAMLS